MLDGGFIFAISVVPDFGWLLVLTSGVLLAFDLQALVPTSNPLTWVPLGRKHALELSERDRQVAFVRVGAIKGRTLGKV
jgi:hypothetical protein